ncbi:hypothetical protein [Tardiphaga sp. 813_E8_N1_3]|uniref:hypothetical protein n=1 Tax=Tardiphaga sp. 813_E8_N1_3 TaxID=3240760 RepID=UPI003F2294DE
MELAWEFTWGITWSGNPTRGARGRIAYRGWKLCFQPEYVVYMMGTALISMWFPPTGRVIQRPQMAVFAGFAATFTARIS